MKKYTKFLGIIVLISMVMGCVASQETKDMLGALGGGVVGGVIGKKVGGKKGMVIGAALGAAIGGTLTHLLTKQDKENIEHILDQQGNEGTKLSWCSGADTRSISTDNSKSCGTERKVSVIPGEIEKLSVDGNQRECRELQIEVLDEKGNLKSDTQQSCKGDDGKWHSA